MDSTSTKGNPEGKRKGRKRGKYGTTQEPLDFPSCRVCGKKSTGIHFGVYSCEACKTFFRRSLLRRTPYKCDEGGTCLIEAEQQRGNTCSACRLLKCLKLGMSKEGVRQGRYTVTQRTNLILEAQKLRSETCDRQAGDVYNEKIPHVENSIDQNDTDLACPSVPFEILREDEIATEGTENLVDSLYTDDSPPTSSCQDIINDSHCPTINDLSEKVGRTSITQDDNADLSPEGTLSRIMTAFSHLEPFTKSLTDQEIQDILQEGLNIHMEKTKLFGKLEYVDTDDYYEIYSKTQMDVDGRKKLFLEGRREFKKMANDYVNFTKNIPFFADLCIEDQTALLKASHFEFFTIMNHRDIDPQREIVITYTGKVLPVSEMCPYTPRETILRWGEFSKEIQKLHLSSAELALILGICVTFRDRCELNAPADVENIQETLLDTLEYTINRSHHPNKGWRFAKLLDLFVRLRVIGDEYLELYKTICQDQCLKDNLPEFLMFL
ncbi:COUP transcription factor 2-like isoform X3 [Ostrea edulis]|nr:COUP transcription factor 2-like isoform X3 [Ostrea edulis]XP_048736126.2 COUP transcription factor 2-like isoform X3 [Ostrea edulis]XP_048736127.2 COUP transcription factor 2-like isoform X3 [Ostrea edulis]